VFQELRRQASVLGQRLAFHHVREKNGASEVDIVIEHGARAQIGIEVKAGSTPRTRDLKGLKKLRDAVGERFVVGVLLYDGEHRLPMGDRLWAVPMCSLWE